MKLAIIGGGGFRVPLIYGALLERRPFDEIVLHDVDAERLDRIAEVLEGQAAEHGDRVPFRATTDLDDAIEGADFVFTAVRVGGLEGRTVDEGVPLGHGVLGQETTGPGGICFALRTIPAVLDVAERVDRRAPGAWIVNFTNPAGIITEALQQVVGDRAIGICDTPSALCRRVAAALHTAPERLSFDYFGLNHLGWLKAVRDGSGDRLPELLADDDALDALEEGRLFGAEWLRSLGMVPNEYLYYFYFEAETVAALGDRPRGAYLLEQQRSFYETRSGTPEQALALWRATKDERDRTYMAEARNGLEGARARSGRAGRLRGRGARRRGGDRLQRGAPCGSSTSPTARLCPSSMRARWSRCRASSAPAAPARWPSARCPTTPEALIETVKAVERATIEAALTGSTELAVKALALHPLVPSVSAARAIFGEYRARLKFLEERFA